ncbi:MAG TPA: DeoR/GlpR family DNA-binding transcription regulator [Clostridia bacterium]|nr:DeoR/GlpR transcriptional regulator [Clostridiaceae bacterium]HOF27451.1 DeoR/GlpR family DNA-binding transcription regulator [Clostridia bacterium]HOM34411.1 DeoR/GlpR family DNA-binding transcription regulator [Clostridia bacterium]HOR90382.1 DeoR/GlpR family DNA-binding transcription regulator [Clostridia bacterium]HOT71151.1 DeoR/GlpR family DNA-binding transcription regulator [Clostridia bacterium]
MKVKRNHNVTNRNPEAMEVTVEERKEKILDMLNRDGRVKVNELSKLFDVSEVTIRLDLSDLEESGLLSRVYGGAVSSYKSYYNMSFKQRSAANSNEKKAIASRVSQMVAENDTLMMNSGTTTLITYMALPKNMHLTVITNSVAIAQEASGNDNHKILLLGGNVNTDYQFTWGEDSLNQLSAYHADKAILSVDGISVKSGLTTYYHQERHITSQMISNSDIAIVTADYTKIGRAALSKITFADRADCIITNLNASAEEIRMLSGKGIKVHLV